MTTTAERSPTIEIKKDAEQRMDSLRQKLGLQTLGELVDLSLKAMESIADLAGEDGIIEFKNSKGGGRRFRIKK